MKSREHSPLLLNKRMMWSELFLGAVRNTDWLGEGGQWGKLYLTKMAATISFHPKFYKYATPLSRGEEYIPLSWNQVGLCDHWDQESSMKMTLWLPGIIYNDVIHFPHGTLPLGIQTSGCEEVQEALGRPTRRGPQGSWPTVLSHSYSQ